MSCPPLLRRDAKYSLSDRYTPRDANGDKVLFYCRVLLGRPVIGQAAFRDATESSDESAKSMVDSLADPSIFVACHDSQAYADYCLTVAVAS